MLSKVKYILLLLVFPTLVLAQSGPNRQGMRLDPKQMAEAEKQLLLDSISGLNNDQKLIIEEIYKDFGNALVKAREAADPDNREAMRETMMSIRKGKDEALQAILTADQHLKFQGMLDKRSEQARNRRRTNE